MAKKEDHIVEHFNTFNKRPLPKRADDLITKCEEAAIKIINEVNNGEDRKLWCTVIKLRDDVKNSWNHEDTFKRWWVDRYVEELSLYIWNSTPKGIGKKTDKASDAAEAKFLKLFA